ncbi:MAG: L-idonate 5-dehydrogenase [Gemmobacter sp.]
MRAFLLHGPQDLRLTNLPVPEPKPGEALVAVRRAGICGSDMHYYRQFQIGSFIPKRPFVLGHEFAGEIVAVGPGVPAARIGQRVTVDPSIPCATCADCRSGRYNLCRDMRFFGSASCDPHINGGFEEFVTAPAANCLPLPDALDWGQAAMIEPLSVAVHAVRRAGTVAGRSVLVTGGGTIGQLTALVARAFGASHLVVSDIAAGPRAFAVTRGADAVLDAASGDFAAQAEALVPGGFDVVIEAAGSAQALDQGLHAARRGGTIVQVGTLPAAVTLPLNMVMARELALLGSFRFANAFQTSIDLLASGRIDVRPLITAVHPLADLPAAIEAAIHDRRNIKVQIAP